MIQGRVERLPCIYNFRQHKAAQKYCAKMLTTQRLLSLATRPGRADVPRAIAGSVMGWREGEMLFGDRDGETAFGGRGEEEDGRMGGWVGRISSSLPVGRTEREGGKEEKCFAF